jgi:serine/threonine protein kinase
MKGHPLCIVMEYVPQGALTNLLRQQPNLSNSFKCKLALDIAKCMAFLHSNSIYHRDLKPDNALVSDKNIFHYSNYHHLSTKVYSSDVNSVVNLKLTDFGTSKSFTNSLYESNYMCARFVPSTSLSPLESTSATNLNALVSKKIERKHSKGIGTFIYVAPEVFILLF